MKNIFRLLAVLCACIAVSCTQEPGVRDVVDFNDDWRFNLGDVPGASVPDFDDDAWRVLDLPHDWAIEGDFDKDNPSGTGGGALPGGIGWYRKTFVPSSAVRSKTSPVTPFFTSSRI